MAEEKAKPTLESLAAKYATRPKETEIKKMTPNSRYVLIHYLFNVLKLPVPRNLKKGELPSTDAANMERQSHPFAARLTQWRSMGRALQSIQGALGFCKPQEVFAGDLASPTGQKAVFWFNIVGHDNIERCFTLAKRSIPINLHKPGRKAFITPEATLDRDVAIKAPGNAELLAALYAGEEVDEPEVLVEADA